MPLTAWDGSTPSIVHFNLRNDGMAKGQKKSNKEVRKPKADKPKTPVVAVSSFLTPPTAKKK